MASTFIDDDNPGGAESPAPDEPAQHEPAQHEPAQPPVALIDQLGELMDVGVVFRLLLLAWLAPASAQLVLGAASVLGVPPIGDELWADRIASVWAGVLLLAVATLIFGARWVVREWEYLPSPKSVGTSPRNRWIHLVAFLVVVVTVTGLPLARSWYGASAVTAFGIVIAGSGFVAMTWLPRWLWAAPMKAAQPLSALTLILGIELSVGWFHLRGIDGPGGFALLAEGVALGASAVIAVRSVGQPAVSPADSLVESADPGLAVLPLNRAIGNP